MVTDRNRFPARFFTFEGGVDSGSAPSAILPNQLSRAVNATVRGGYVSCRPGFQRRRLAFANASTKAAFEDGFFQGAGTYIADDGSAFILASISGRIFKTRIMDEFATEELVVPGLTNNPTKQKAWFCQAENFLVVQDKESRPIIWDGSSVRRSADLEVPIGGPMAYGKGRLWVANRNYYVGGDLVDSTDAGRASVVKFEENDYIAEGGAFVAPAEITGLAFMANQDSSTGEGGLIVTTAGAAVEFDAPVDRDAWKNLTQPIQRFALLEFGSFSHESIALVNGDLFFRSQDGIRSLKYAQREFDGWGNTPASDEVSWILNYDDEHLLHHASAVNFDNRLLMTARPQLSERGIWHEALVSLDFKPISKMNRKAAPAWEGAWSGMRVLQLLTIKTLGVRRCFAYALDADMRICLFELSKSAAYDNTKTPIYWPIETRGFTFGNNDGMSAFALETGDVWFAGVTGTLKVTSRFRMDETPCWVHWHTWQECVQATTELDGRPVPPEMSDSLPLPRRSFPQPPAAPDPNLRRPLREGFETQLRLELTGKASIRRGCLIAAAVPENKTGTIVAPATCPPPARQMIVSIIDEDSAQIIQP